MLDFNEVFDENPSAPLRKLLPRSLLHYPSPPGKALAVTCQLDLGRSNFRTFQFSSVSATASWERGRFRVKDLRASMDGGSISLISDAWKEKDLVPFDVTLTLDEIDISRLLSSLSVSDSLFQGNLFLSGAFHGLWKGIGGWKRHLGGDLYLDSRGGVIRRYELLTKILTLVNFTQWSSVHLLDLKARGLPYQRINGHLALDSGVISTEDLFVDTSIAFVTVVGSYDYVRDNLDVQLAARPLEKLDRVIDQVPVVGRILQGEDGTTVIFYYKLSGPMKDPQVALVPFKGMSERMRSLFDRIRTGIESRQF